MATVLEKLQQAQSLLAEAIQLHNQGETPEPVEPTPTPQPAVTLQLFDSSGDEWLNGVSKQTSRFLLQENDRNKRTVKPGVQVRFSNGELRKVTRVDVAYKALFVAYEGGKLDAAGLEPRIEVVGATGEAEQPSEPEPTPGVKRKGMVCTNLGMGQGAPNRGVGTQGTDYNFPIESEIIRAKGYGLTRFRVGGLFERFFKRQGSTEMYLGLDAKGKEYSSASVHRVGQLCKKHGCDVLWNPFHNYGTVFGKKVGSSGGLTAQQFGQAWRAFILHVKSDPDAWAATYGFDLMNEWSGMEFSPIFDATQAVLDACGDILEDKFIVPEGKDYSSTANWVRNNDGFTKLVDPRGPGFLEFSGHLYLDSDASGYYKTDTVHPSEAARGVTPETVGTARLAGFADWLDANGYRGNIGETITPGDMPRLLKGLENMLVMARDRGIDVYIFGMGDWFSDNYSTVHNLEIERNRPTLELVKRFASAS